ncbi:methanogen output domain 1-containing protein [Maliponia aquimaris]|uniref:Metanogen output domain-containing protein n=1 Tax=Maliponia aquimaris TaxID=1673631 RepID=A0A238JQD2_9RHOB|nr:methanogen output domain 1-containing protein [Maliponia aquimaris]SMX32861.1 hypothetical protein MAA8898_00346 [Maliponia aquimaris]
MNETRPQANPTALTADAFFAELIGSLSGTLQEVVGVEDTCAFIARVGDDMGRGIADRYRQPDGTLPHEPEQIGRILCDLKARIGGHFEMTEASPERIVFTASRCPFGKQVEGRPSLCMMTTNVFGRIAAEATGYASVRIDEALSLGHSRCRVTVHLTRSTGSELHEFFG